MSGPPAYAVRLRRIEDLECELVELLIEKRAVDGPTIPIGVARKLEELNRLIVEHNLYYPVEKNLPVDVRSGQLLDLGEPWRPLSAVTGTSSTRAMSSSPATALATSAGWP